MRIDGKIIGKLTKKEISWFLDMDIEERKNFLEHKKKEIEIKEKERENKNLKKILKSLLFA